MSAEVKEVMATFRVAAQQGSSSLNAYVISMARDASDVLAVELLKREACLTVRILMQHCHVCPLDACLAVICQNATVQDGKC